MAQRHGTGPEIPSRTCPRCGQETAVFETVCPACGYSALPARRPDPLREPSRRLWIALIAAVGTLLLSFCLLYAIIRAFRT